MEFFKNIFNSIFEKSKIFQRKKLGNPGTKSTILVVQTASEPVIPLPRVLKAAKAGPAPRVNLVDIIKHVFLGCKNQAFSGLEIASGYGRQEGVQRYRGPLHEVK